MGRSYFLRFLLFSAVLALCLSQGFGRKLMELENEDSAVLLEENTGKARKMIEVMDYTDPEANTNPRTGYLFTPPPSPLSPPAQPVRWH
ncbi:hypothetical protein BVC80_1753g22 [Macleaya cordata]|uniref:Uncharacterized protein n=1 Tax=Macleaya cordata TaxID=56857 RepID=A0A200QHE3_MACCD|nr:hypothetical protein BVC80_1753g22 [Macleaya cordata]